MATTEADAKKQQVAKLPQWAQARIQWLESRVQQYEQELAAIRGGRPDSPIQVTPGGVEPKYGLAEWASVRFRLGNRRYDAGDPRHWVEMRIRDDGGTGVVELMGSSELSLYARSSNVLNVDVADRYELQERAPVRDLGERLIKELEAKGLDWQDGLNLIKTADRTTVKRQRVFKDGDV